MTDTDYDAPRIDPSTKDLDGLPLGDQAPNNATTVALANVLVVASGPCRLFGLSGYSNRASAQFIQIHDAQAVPADGAVPEIVFAVGLGNGASTGTFSVWFGEIGRWFDRGIVVCNSTTAATKTIGSADTFIDAQWI